MIKYLYTLCYNEMDILPFVIDYWKRLNLTKVVVFDNGSNDGSVEYLSKYDWIEVRYFKTEGMNDFVQQYIKNKCWLEAKGKADFVIVCDMDELLYSNHFDEELQYMKDNDYNVLGNQWYALCGDERPTYQEGKLLHELVKKGYKQDINRNRPDLGKYLVIDPNKVDDMRWSVGNHIANPIPELRLYESNKIFTIHIDKGLSEDYFVEKRKKMYKRLSDDNKKYGLCFEYGFPEDKSRYDYRENQKKAVNLLDIITL